MLKNKSGIMLGAIVRESALHTSIQLVKSRIMKALGFIISAVCLTNDARAVASAQTHKTSK